MLDDSGNKLFDDCCALFIDYQMLDEWQQAAFYQAEIYHEHVAHLWNLGGPQ